MTPSSLKERQEFLSLVEECFHEKSYDRAIGLARKRLSRFPGDMDAWLVIACCWINAGKLREAGEILKELDGIVDRWSRIYQYIGDTYQQHGLIPDAERSYHKARNLCAGTQGAGAAATQSAAAEAGRVDTRAGGDDISDIEQISSDFHTVTLAELYIKQGHLKMARDVLQKMVTRDPQNTEVLERLEYVRTLMRPHRNNRNARALKTLNGWLHNLEKSKMSP